MKSHVRTMCGLLLALAPCVGAYGDDLKKTRGQDDSIGVDVPVTATEGEIISRRLNFVRLAAHL